MLLPFQINLVMDWVRRGMEFDILFKSNLIVIVVFIKLVIIVSLFFFFFLEEGDNSIC